MVISKPGCGACVAAKNLLIQKGRSFDWSDFYTLPEDEKADYLSQASDAGILSFPLILTGEKMISFEDLKVYLEQ